jgi:hypothetical protein
VEGLADGRVGNLALVRAQKDNSRISTKYIKEMLKIPFYAGSLTST